MMMVCIHTPVPESRIWPREDLADEVLQNSCLWPLLFLSPLLSTPAYFSHRVLQGRLLRHLPVLSGGDASAVCALAHHESHAGGHGGPVQTDVDSI